MTWCYDKPSVARTTHVSNKFPWSQRGSSHWGLTVHCIQITSGLFMRIYFNRSRELIVVWFQIWIPVFVCTFSIIPQWDLFINFLVVSPIPVRFAQVTYLITKTYLYNFYPFKPHFYIVKLGFTGLYIIFLISAQKHRLWVLVRTASPRRF